MSEMKQPDMERRQFLSQGVKAAAGLTLAPGVMLYGIAHAKDDAQPASSKVRWGMLVDSNKCASGCSDCVDACKSENGWGDKEKHSAPEQQSHWIRKIELRHKTTKHAVSLPVMCQHCETPPCADVCPTGASFKRADGIVLVDRHICIGCRYCMMACPYKARSLVHEEIEGQKPYMPRGKGTVEACTLCVHRVDEGRLPACVEGCREQAIVFGDLNNPDSDIAKAVSKYASNEIRADLGLNTGVRYRGI